jgi:hypothetical protein
VVDEPDAIWTFWQGVQDVPGLEDEFPNGPPTSVIAHRGCRIVLRFAPGDITAEGDVQEMRILPGSSPLKPKMLRQFAPNAEVYLALARAKMRQWAPGEAPEARLEKLASAIQALREIAGPGRGLPEDFYPTIAATYEAFVAEGEPHPIKALGEKHHVTISAASRWVKEARRRGYLPEKQES